MKLTRNATIAVVLLLTSAPSVWADFFAAIAYSPSTGRYGYATGCDSQGQAERRALRACATDDAEIEIWVEDGWAALAVDKDGNFATGWSTNSRGEAERIALGGVGKGKRILCWVASGK